MGFAVAEQAYDGVVGWVVDRTVGEPLHEPQVVDDDVA
jgi:hypothetical protein